MKKLLFIDNYDSFVYNLVQYFGELSSSGSSFEIVVVRNDEITVDDVKEISPFAIVISPGPGVPSDAGISEEVIATLHESIPILGVCLGHQAIGEVFGAKIVRAPQPKHGKVSLVKHDGNFLFEGLENPLSVVRYHSLVISRENLPESIIPVAFSEDDFQIMAVRIEGYPVFGVQFHPESYATEGSKSLVANFLKIAHSFYKMHDRKIFYRSEAYIGDLRKSEVQSAEGGSEVQEIGVFSLKDALHKVVAFKDLSENEAYLSMLEIMDGKSSPEIVSAFLVAMRMKGEKGHELSAMAKVMKEKAVKIEGKHPLVDTCGTGGDGLGTFNVSTAASLLVASCGLNVAKHGNRAVSSKTGSADILEALGVDLSLPPEEVERRLKEVGFAFLFAPAFHPAMKNVAPVRKALGLRTFFNILGPMVNPASPDYQLLGVYDFSLAEKIAYVLASLGVKKGWIVNTSGADEILPIAPADVLEFESEDGVLKKYRKFRFDPVEEGLIDKYYSIEDLYPPASREAYIDEFKRLLLGQIDGVEAKAHAVVLNSAPLLVLSGISSNIKEAYERCFSALKEGKPCEVLKKYTGA